MRRCREAKRAHEVCFTTSSNFPCALRIYDWFCGYRQRLAADFEKTNYTIVLY